jgi:hypothetical protein
MNLWTSIRRTVIPTVVGALMASAAGPWLDEALVTEALVALFAAVYYTAARLLEEAGFRWASVMLGGGTAPHYEQDTDTQP